MFVLHTHWRPPRRATDPGEIFFWAENSEAPAPGYLRGRLPKKHSAKTHPFCLPSEVMRESLGVGTPLGNAHADLAKMRIPSTRTGPLPSQELAHSWNMDVHTRPFMAPYIINGLSLNASKAFGVLVSLPNQSHEHGFILGQDARFWRKVALYVMEILAAQRVVPVLLPARGDGHYHSRWSPVLDAPHDGARIAQLVGAMPPVCRIDLMHPNGRYHGVDEKPQQIVLISFLKTMVDALMRSWGKSCAPHFTPREDDPFHAWVAALFQEDATVRASHAQLQSLESNMRSWMRNLQAAGDAVFRIAFQVEPTAVEENDLSAASSATANAGPATSVTQGNGQASHEWTLSFHLQARDDLSLLVPAEEVWHKAGGMQIYSGRRFENPQEKLLAGLGYAARLFPPLLPALQTSHPVTTTLTTELAYTFLHNTSRLLEQAGFGLIPPRWWNQPEARLGVRLRLSPHDEKSSGSRQAPDLVRGKLSLDRLVDYKWELALGDSTITRREFESLAALKSPLVQIRGRWIQLDAEQIEAADKFLKTASKSGTMSLLQAAQFGMGGKSDSQALPLTDVIAEDWVSEWMDRLANHDKMTELLQPTRMLGELRPYQRHGYSWLAFFRRWGLGACLADDMGLGKTIQALALLQYEKENQQLEGPVLLICPTSVVTNWQKEVQRFTPELTTQIHQGPNRWRGEELIEKVKGVNLLLTSYAVVRQDAELLQKVNWFGIIVDEAQNIKNASSKQAQVIRQLNSTFRLALTGTPVENRLVELWSIMQFLNPGYLQTKEAFRRDFAIPIERFGDPEATQRLRKLIAPFILRRMKSDPKIIQDLPEKIEVKEYCSLSEEQAALYEATVQNTLNLVADSSGIKRKGLILTLLMQLKQICNHPLQYMHQIENAMLDHSEINGRSGKLLRLNELLDEILESGDRVLIFTQFAEMGKLLFTYLTHVLGYPALFLHGGTPVRQREQMIQHFQDEDSSAVAAPSIFILSLKAGGLGVNLTRANHVIHFDRWWNPAVEDQATDRSYRIGQKSNVQVHKFITTGTLEERIDEMIESKKGLAEAIIGSGEQWLTELSTDELRQMVQLRKS